LSKLQQPYDFLASVYGYGLVGRTPGLWIARGLPWLELVVGICLMAGVLDRGGMAIGSLLLAVFTIAKLYAVSRGVKIPCGCFLRDASSSITPSDVFLTGLLCALALAALAVACRADRRPDATA
jgi:hypothetical protein